MATLRRPPRGLDRATIHLVRLAPACLHRIAYADSASWLHFGEEAKYRFNAPNGRYGVLYAATDFATALSETIVRDYAAVIPPGEPIPLVRNKLAQRRYVLLANAYRGALLQLIDVTNEATLRALRTDQRLSTEYRYDITRAWSNALHALPQAFDGILYSPRFGDKRSFSVALFDRCCNKLAIQPGRVRKLNGRLRALQAVLARGDIALV
jgi:hypothetical protein